MATSTQITQVTQLFTALFMRAPAVSGLNYYTGRLDTGATLDTVAQEMYDTAPARTYYADGATPNEIVTSFFTNTLGRAPLQGGLDYWSLQLATKTQGQVIAEMILSVTNFVPTGDGSESDTQGTTSQSLFENKVTVGEYFATVLLATDATLAAAAYDLVTADPASVATANAANTTAVAATQPVTYTLAASSTSLVAEGGDVTFTVTPSTASDADVTLYIQITGASVGAITTQASADDFSAVLLPVTIAAGSATPVIVSATVSTDATTEGPEGFQANLLDSSFAAVSGVAAITGTITESTSSGQTYALTTSIDNKTGTSGDDTFNGSSVDANATGTTINPGDNLNGGDGTDTVAIAASGSTTLTNVSAVTYTGIEKVLVSEYNSKGGGNSTVDLSLADSSLTTVGLSSSDSTGTLEFTGLKKVVDAEMKNGTNSLTLTFTSGNTGTTDVVNLAVSGQSASTFTAAGIETVNVNSTLVKSAITLVGGNIATVGVTGDTEVAVTLPATVTAIDASAATGKVTIDSAAITLADITSAKGGTGSTDVFKIDEAVTASSKLSKITGFETIAVDGGVAVTLDAAVAGVTTIDLSNATNATLALASGYTGATTVKLGADEGDSVTDNANIALTVNADVSSVTTGTTVAAGSGTTDAMNLTADGVGATLTSVTGFETLNILANTTTASTATGAIVTVDGNVATGKTQTVSAAALTNSSAIFTFNASAETNGHYVITGGAGKDVITLGNAGDSVDGGANDDNITAGTGVDSIQGGAGNDTITLGANLTASDTIDGGDGTDTLSVTTISDTAAFANVTNVENIAISDAGAISLTSPVAATLALDFSATSAQSLTLGTGYTGTTTVKLTGDGGTGDDVINTANVTLTVNANETDVAAGSTLTGGTGTDTLNIRADGGSADLTNVTLFETINVLANTTTASTVVGLSNLALAAGKSTTVDATALTDSGAALTWTSGTITGNLVINGGAGNDSITLTGAGKTTVSGGAGKDTIIAATGVDSLSGGDGNDTFTMAASLTVLDTIDGGAGTDTITITTYAAASLQNVTNVEVLAVTGGGNTAAIDSTANSFTTFDLATDSANADKVTLGAGYTGTATVSVSTADDVTNGATVVATGKADSTNSPLWANTTLTVKGNAGNVTAGNILIGGTGSDTLELTADNNGTGAVLTGVTAFETITVKANSTTASNSAKITLTAATVVADGATLTVNASALTAAGATFTYDGSSIADATTVDQNGGGTATTSGTGKQVVTGGANADFIKTGEGADSINGGTGADTITGGKGLDTITGGAGADVIDVSTNANALSFATVTDFAAGDRLYFSSDNGGGTGLTTLTKVSLSAQATLSDYINAAASANIAASSKISWFNFGSNTYVVQDNDSGLTFTAGTDRVIELQGVLDLTDGDAAVVTSNATTQTLTFATTGVDIATAPAAPAMTYVGTSGTDSLVGAAGIDDTFSFTAANFTSVDTVTGSTHAVADTIAITDASLTAAVDADFTLVTGVEKLTVTGTSTVALGAASSTAGITTVAQSSSGNLIVDATGATALTTVTTTGTGTAVITFGDIAGNAGTFTHSSTGNATVTGGAAGDTITVTGLATASQTFTGTVSMFKITAGANAQTITLSGALNDTVIGGLGSDTIDVGAGTNQIKYIEALSSDIMTGVNAGTNSWHFDASATGIALTLTDAAAGDITAATGTVLNATDYFESATGYGVNGADLSAKDVILINGTVGTYASSDLAIAGLNAASAASGDGSTHVALGATAVIVVYATAADTYKMVYDSNGTTAGGESTITTLVGLTNANIDAYFSAANFYLGA